MSRYLANLAARAVGAESGHRSHLLRPVIPSIFAASAAEWNAPAAMELNVDEVRPVARNKQPMAASRAFDPDPTPAGARHQLGEEPGETPVAWRSAGRDAEVGVEEAAPSSVHQPKSSIRQSPEINSGNSVRNEGLPVRSLQAVEKAVDRGLEDQIRQTDSQPFANIHQGKLNLPSSMTTPVEHVDRAAGRLGSAVRRDVFSAQPAELHETSAAVLQTLGSVAASSELELRMRSLASSESKPQVARSSSVHGGVALTARPHGEALPERSPGREIGKASMRGSSTGAGRSAISDVNGLRDRATAAPLAQNRPSLPGALRSITAAHQPAPSASQSVVEVHIGRVEVRAPSQSSSRGAARETTKAPSLDDYLRGRTGRGRA